MKPEDTFYDVVIAGAGPVGLFLACELRLAGCSVVVLERDADPNSSLKGMPFGLRGLSVPTIESLDRRDLLDAIRHGAVDREAPAAAHWMRQKRQPAGHFAGMQFFQDQIDGARPYRPFGAISGVAVDMANLEATLAARATALGAEIRRGCTVEECRQSDDDVTVHAGEAMVRGRWLVGCDGGRSRVRKAAGIAFEGTDPEFTGYSVVVDLVDPDALAPGRHYTAAGIYTYAPSGTIAMVDFDGGASHRIDPITPAYVQTVLRRITGIDLAVSGLRQATTWTDRAYQASDYRKGRVLLAGDAAHVHSPLGGQGLNLGLGDAMNLGWKLAAAIRGDAPPGLLDSYAHERQPVGAQVLDWSRAQVALMRPSRSSRALAAIVRDLIETRDGATYFADRLLGLSLRYDLGDAHPLTGRSAPDIEFADGTRLNARLRNGRGLVVDFDAQASLRKLAGLYEDRIEYIEGDASNRFGLSALVVRPDGIVAWASDCHGNGDDAAQAVARWFGQGRLAEISR